jgi:hypothetical protein
LVPERLTLPDAKEVGNQLYLERTSQQELAAWAKMSTYCARKIIIELMNTGSLTDPDITNSERVSARKKNFFIWIQPRSYSC